jgi:hypothetical protein
VRKEQKREEAEMMTDGKGEKEKKKLTEGEEEE